MADVLTVAGISKKFVTASGLFRRRYTVVSAVDDVSFSIRDGETFGLVGEVLKTMAFGVRAAIEAALGAMQYAHIAAPAGAAAEQNMHLALAQHGLSIDGIGLVYQFGYLVLPAVVPVALWIVMNRSFLESLVGWSGEPGGEAAGPRDGSAGTASGGKNA